MLPNDIEVRKMIRKESAKGMAVAELEYIGLSLRVINLLEEKIDIVYMHQLIDKSEEFLLDVDQLGLSAVKQIKNALRRFPELEKERHRWHKGSDKTEFYKTKTNIVASLA